MYKFAFDTEVYLYTTFLFFSTGIVLEPQNPSVNKIYIAQKRRSTDFKALKLGNVRSGLLVSVQFVLVRFLTSHPRTIFIFFYSPFFTSSEAAAVCVRTSVCLHASSANTHFDSSCKVWTSASCMHVRTYT